MKEILVIGAGGIGSYLAEFLNKANLYQQLEADITFYDDDFVEPKNLSYQNYDTTHLGNPKVESIEERYMFRGVEKRIKDAKDLERYDLVILAVDNMKARQLVYEHAKDWIDLRSKGRIVTLFKKSKKNTAKYMAQFSKTKKGEESTSCQNKFELESGLVQYGNLIVASIGLQLIVNHLRGEETIDQFIHQF